MDKKTECKKTILMCLFFGLYFFYMELVVMLYCFKSILPWGALYTLGFSLVFGLIAGLLSSVWGRRGNKIVSIFFGALAALIMGIQTVYFTIFKTFTTVSSASNAGDVLSDFWEEALQGIADSWLPLLILLLPLVLFIIFGSRITPQKRPGWKNIVILILVTAALNAVTTLGVVYNTSGVMSYSYVYSDTFSPELSVPRFGVLTTTRLDIKHAVFGDLEVDPLIPETPPSEQDDLSDITKDNDDEITVIDPEPVVYEENVLDIDFESLIASTEDETVRDMHTYFSTRTPTMQNEYTGMFEGKNLIWIVAEGFSSLALDETHTPTLTKMSREGFVFNNFYNPLWGVSTSDGEYVTLTGLIPKSGVWSFKTSADNYMPFGFGTLFSDIGYTSRAYHNHTYTYYGRNLSHPNMGYDYKGMGNGLNVKEQWPESDVEMMELSVPEYINDENFHVYYLTVSGHLNYNFYGNLMAAKHKAEVQDMRDAGYSDAAAAYIATQMEFDQSVEYLINSLKAAGKLDDTVIVISGDHHPYGLTIEEREELAGGDIDPVFEDFRSTLMIWNSEMEPVQVDKYCSSLDVMPTLANLFGLEYDSRLVMGSDILSDSPALVMFNNRSFITAYGRYNSVTDEFIPNEGATVDDGYAAQVLGIVNDKFSYSAKILDHDYYAKVFPEAEREG